MPASHLAGSVSFGPVNNSDRSYLHTLPTLPNSDWVIGIQFRPNLARGYAATSSLLFGSTSNTSGGGGNDWGFLYYGSEFGGLTNSLLFRARVGGVELGTGAMLTVANVINKDTTYWAFAQRVGSFVEFWTCPANGTATLHANQALNGSFGSRTLSAGSFGPRFRGSLGEMLNAHQSLTQAEIESIASGTDPDSIITTVGNRKSFISFASPAATITNDWGGNTATQSGTWTNRPTASPLQVAPTVSQIRTTIRPYQVYPRRIASAVSNRVFTGTYHNFTPTGIQYRILSTVDLSTIQNWASLTSFSASAGTWTGTSSLPEGDAYYLQFRDATDNSIQFLSDAPVAVVPTIVTTGQSPMAIIDTDGKGQDTLTGRAYSYHGAFSTYSEPALLTGPELSVGHVNLANQFTTDTSGKAVGILPLAVSGTSVTSWAGWQEIVVNSSASYTVGETVTILNSGTPIGTGVVVSSSGTSLVLKWTDITIAVGNTITGQTSAVSRTTSIASAVLGADTTITWPRCKAGIIDSGVRDCDLAFYWLNGSSDTGNAASAGTYFDALWARMIAELAPYSITPYFVMVPHNRQTSSSASTNFDIRKAQRDWAASHALFGSRVFLGWQAQDMQLLGEFVATATAGASGSVTLPSNIDTQQLQTSVYPTTVTITSGTGAGQTRTGTAYNTGTRVLTVTPAWSTTPDNTSVLLCSLNGPHQNYAGSRRLGVRFGRSIARRYGYIATADVGPTITSVTRNTAGDVLTVNCTHTNGTALRTPNGGTGATTVAGFEVSEDSFSSNNTISAIAITGANTIQITLATPPSVPANLQVRYLYGAPISQTNWQQLSDLVYDNQSIGDTSGQPLQTTWTPVNATLATGDITYRNMLLMGIG